MVELFIGFPHLVGADLWVLRPGSWQLYSGALWLCLASEADTGPCDLMEQLEDASHVAVYSWLECLQLPGVPVSTYHHDILP